MSSGPFRQGRPFSFQAEREARRVYEAKLTSDHRLYLAEIHLAEQAWHGGRIELVPHHLTQAVESKRPEDPDPRDFEWHYLKRQCQLDRPPLRHGGLVRAVTFSSDGHLLASAGNEGTIKIWNVETGEVKADVSKEMKERMCSAAYSPDGKWLAVLRGGESNGLAGKITLLDPATGKKIRETSPGHLDGGTDLAFHPDGKHIFSSGRDTLVKIWQLEDVKHVRDIGQGRGDPSSGAHPKGRMRFDGVDNDVGIQENNHLSSARMVAR